MTLRQPSRSRIQLLKLTVFNLDAEYFRQHRRAGLSLARFPTHSFPFLSFSPLLTFAHSVLVYPAMDSPINISPGLPKKQVIAAPPSPSFSFACVRLSGRRIDDKPSQRPIVRLSVSQFVRSSSLAAFSPSQIVSRFVIAPSVLTGGPATLTCLPPLFVIAIYLSLARSRIFKDVASDSLFLLSFST